MSFRLPLHNFVACGKSALKPAILRVSLACAARWVELFTSDGVSGSAGAGGLGAAGAVGTLATTASADATGFGGAVGALATTAWADATGFGKAVGALATTASAGATAFGGAVGTGTGWSTGFGTGLVCSALPGVGWSCLDQEDKGGLSATPGLTPTAFSACGHHSCNTLSALATSDILSPSGITCEADGPLGVR